MSDLQNFIDRAWADHADDAWGVSLRLPAALDLVTDADGLLDLARLASHVYGEHLARWADGLKYLAALARGPGFDAAGAQGRALRVLRAALALAAESGDARATLDASDRIAVTARAGMLLARHDAVRSRALFDEALAAAESEALPGADPAIRALAIAGNNIASALVDQASRSEAGRALMLHAALSSRRCWELAGTWLEIERADYGLALAWLAGGDPAQARRHAQACLAIVDAQPTPSALERFFGCEALARAERAAGDAAAHAQALQAAQLAFAALSPDDQATCAKTLDALREG